MSRTAALISALALSATTGCVVYSDDHHDDDVVVVVEEPVNYTPTVAWAEAGCYWSEYHGDFIWYFDSEVWDDNDYVTGVYADVFDAYGNWVDTFELYQEHDPVIWFSDWLQYSTYLDCYYGGYTVEFVAYDTYEAYDAIAVYPYTY